MIGLSKTARIEWISNLNSSEDGILIIQTFRNLYFIFDQRMTQITLFGTVSILLAAAIVNFAGNFKLDDNQIAIFDYGQLKLKIGIFIFIQLF